MKNKALAFDYITEYLYRDKEISKVVETDMSITTEEKEEILTILSQINIAFNNSSKYHEIINEENRKMAIATNKMIVDNMKNTYDTIISIKSSLQDVINDAKRAYSYVLWMYILAFLIGLGLIIVSIVFAAQGKTILAIAFGTIGLIDLVTYFIYKPPLEIQNSRSNLAQLMIIITNWFADLMNLNTYMANKGSEITFEEISKISDKQNANTTKMIELIEKYSESRKSDK